MGPASVLYGSDAVGGTLNALPVTPPDYDGAPTWSRRLLLRAASADESVLGRVQLGGRVNPNLGFVGGLSLKRFGDLRGGDEVGEQPHTGYDELDYDGQVDYYVDEELWLRLGHQSVDQDDAWRTHRTIYGPRWHGLAAGDDKVHVFDQRRTLTYLKVHSEKLLGFVDGAELTLSRHAQAEDLYRIKKDATGERQGFDVTTWGASLQMQSDSPLGLWVYGVDLAHDVVVSYARKYKADGSFSKSEIQGPVADAAAYDTAGVFVEDTLPLLDGALDLAPGLRYTYARADADRVKDPITGKATGLSGDWDAVVGSLRALHPLTDDRRHTVFAGAAQGFRAPNLSDLTRFDIARSTEIETPVRDLDPERFLSGELGVRSLGERLETEVSYYYTLIDDLIVRTPTGRKVEGLNEVTKRNAGEGYVQGVEAAETCRLTREWSIWGRAAWMAGKVDAYPSSSARKERDYLSRLMPPTGAAGVRWQLEDGRLWCETSANLAGKADRLSADDKRDTQRIPPGGTPGYAVWNARVGVRLLSSVDLALAVENLLDADYRIHGSGVNEPGRNVLLTAACDF